jgi:superfamily II DNA or RNA helicase
MTFVARPYQTEALDAIREAYRRRVLAQLLAMATGTGKTSIFALLVKEMIDSGQARNAIVIAHRDALITQAAERIATVVPWSKIGIIKGQVKQWNAQVAVASVQTLARKSNMPRCPKYDLVIVDEAHRAASRSHRAVIEQARHPETLLCGFTATPNRSDGIGLSKVFDEIVYEYPLLQAIEDGWLAQVVSYEVGLACDLSKLEMKREDGELDVNLDQLEEVMTAANWYQFVAEEWGRRASDRLTIAFTPRVKMAYRFAEYMRGLGVNAAAMDGSVDQALQRRMRERFKRGEIQMLVACDLLTEGVDLPPTNCVLVARPTKSFTILSQMIGRGTRKSDETGKTDCIVLYVRGVGAFDFCTPASLIGVREVRDGETLQKAKQRELQEDQERASQEEIPEMVQGQVVSRKVDLFNGRQPNKSLFNWQAHPEQRRSSLLVAGHRIEVWRESADGPYIYADMAWRSRFAGQTWDRNEAKAACEAEARRLIYGEWANDPATEKQIKLMVKNKIQFRPHVTKGEAKELLQPIFDRIERAKKARAGA